MSKASHLLAVIILLTITAGCSQRHTARAAQQLLEPYQVYVKGSSIGQPAHLSATTGINSRFIAAAGEVDFAVEVYAPILPGGGSALVWRHELKYSSGHQSWEVCLTFDKDNEFIQVKPTTWDEAKASLIHLPNLGTDDAVLALSPHDSSLSPSQRYKLHRSKK